MEGPNSLFTCRYWAFGPACPNIGSGGNNVCKFAHWDTGRLASEFQQRGTCQYWVKGTCKKGQACWYEHRKTGVDGMYQGPLNLNGMNLEIASAAAKSGFNTWNHAALHDLIWSVKRVALRHCRKDVDVPRPKDPYYPDRYRPSGLGDNSSKKRPAPPPEPPAAVAVKLEPQPKMRQRMFKYKNRAINSMDSRRSTPRASTTLINVGTRNDPIDLASDDEGVAVSKRQKLDTSFVCNLKPEANQSRSRVSAINVEPRLATEQTATQSSRIEAVSNWKIDGATGNHSFSLPAISTDKARKCSGGVFTQQHDFVSLIDLDIPKQAKSITTALSPLVTLGQSSTATGLKSKVPIELSVVRHKMDLTAGEMLKCRMIMRKTFNKHEDKFKRDECIDDLRALSDIFGYTEECSRKGVQHLDRVKDAVSRM